MSHDWSEHQSDIRCPMAQSKAGHHLAVFVGPTWLVAFSWTSRSFITIFSSVMVPIITKVIFLYTVDLCLKVATMKPRLHKIPHFCLSFDYIPTHAYYRPHGIVFSWVLTDCSTYTRSTSPRWFTVMTILSWFISGTHRYITSNGCVRAWMSVLWLKMITNALLWLLKTPFPPQKTPIVIHL